MTPIIAVFSVGHWDFGQNSTSNFTTFHYGHPREDIVRDLEGEIRRRRSARIEVMVARGSEDFRERTIRRAVYATAWDGTVKVRAHTDGTFTVTRNN